MKSKLLSLRSRLAMALMVMTASFQWSCVEMEEPRVTRSNRPVERVKKQKNPEERSRIRLSPDPRIHFEDKRLRGN